MYIMKSMIKNKQKKEVNIKKQKNTYHATYT